MSRKTSFILALLVIATTYIFSPVMAQEETTVPVNAALTLDNVFELELLDTLPDYRLETAPCSCDDILLSANGRIVASDRRIRNLSTGQTFDFLGRGFPKALSADGRYAIVSGEQAGTSLVDLQNLSETYLQAEYAESATFSPDGTMFAIASRQADSVQLWATYLATQIRSFTPSYRGEQPVFSPDGRALFFQAEFQSVYRWRIGAPAADYITQTDQIPVTFFNSLVATRMDDVWELRDVNTLELVHRIGGMRDGISSDQVAINPDQTRAIITYSTYGFELWDISGSAPALISWVEGRYGGTTVFSPDARYFAITNPEFYNEGIETFDVQTGRSRSRMYTGWIVGLQTNNTRDLLFTQLHPEVLIIWTWNDGMLTEAGRLPGSNLALSADNSTLAVALKPTMIAVFGVSDTPANYAIPAEIVPSSVNVRASPDDAADIIGNVRRDVLVFGRSEDSRYLYLPDSGGWISGDSLFVRLPESVTPANLPLFDAEALSEYNSLTQLTLLNEPAEVVPSVVDLSQTAPVLSSLILDVGTPLHPLPSLEEDIIPITPETADQVELLGIIPDTDLNYGQFATQVSTVTSGGRHYLASPTPSEQSVRIWNLHTLELEQSQMPGEGVNAYTGAIVPNPRSSTFVYTSLRTRTPLIMARFDGGVFDEYADLGTEDFNAVEFSSDGTILRVDARLYQAATGTPIRAFDDAMTTITLSADNSRLAGTSDDRLMIYDIPSGVQIARSDRELDYRFRPSPLMFSPDNEWLLSDTVADFRLLSGDTAQTVAILASGLNEEPRFIERAVFSPDGRFVFVLVASDELRVFDLRTLEVIGSYAVTGAMTFDLSPDGNLLAIGNPLQIIDLTSGQTIPIEGNYNASRIVFAADGASILTQSESGSYWLDYNSVMVFGVPTQMRPPWTPVNAEIRPSSISVREALNEDSPVIGYAMGEVEVSARDDSGTAVFLPAYGGWVWAADEYIIIDQSTLASLPVRVTE